MGRPGQATRPAASLEEFVGHPACGIGQLHGDLERFVFRGRWLITNYGQG